MASDGVKITYEARTALPIDDLVDFQGDAKTITQDNLDRLKRSILRHGFFVPVFVWRKTPKSPAYIIDGHQRLKALAQLRDEGHDVPPVPVEFIEAKSRKDAGEKLLAVTSQFGEFNVEALEDWAHTLQLNLPRLDVRLVDHEIDLTKLEIDVDAYFENAEGGGVRAPRIATCPKCGHVFEL